MSAVCQDTKKQESQTMCWAKLVPESSNIKYDGALDLYSCIEDDVILDKVGGVQKLTQLLDGIDTKTFDPALLEDYKLLKGDVAKL